MHCDDESTSTSTDQTRVVACVEKHVDSPPDGQTSQKLVPQRLGLSDGGKSSVLDLFGVELQRVLGELEPLGDQGGQLPDPPALLSEDILGVGGTDDDLGLGVGGSDLTTGVTLLGELTGAGRCSEIKEADRGHEHEFRVVAMRYVSGGEAIG